MELLNFQINNIDCSGHIILFSTIFHSVLVFTIFRPFLKLNLNIFCLALEYKKNSNVFKELPPLIWDFMVTNICFTGSTMCLQVKLHL